MIVVVNRDKSIRQILITLDAGLGGALVWGRVRFNFMNKYRLMLSYAASVAREKTFNIIMSQGGFRCALKRQKK